MKHLKKLLAFGLVGVLCMQLAACKGDTSNTADSTTSKSTATQTESTAQAGNNGFKAVNHDNVSAPGQFPICKEKTVIRIGFSQDSFVEDYETNAYTKWLEGKGNFDLEFELYPGSDAAQKVRIMISSGTDLPDIVSGFHVPNLDLLSYGSQGSIIALNDYYDTYGYYSKDVFTSENNYR